MGRELEELRRQVQSDPTNRDAALALIQSRARIDGPQVFLELLRDIALWDRAPDSLKEAAVGAAGLALGEGYSLRAFEEYACGGQRHRIPTFSYEPLGLALQLIPGGRGIMGCEGHMTERPVHDVVINRPFLLGRYPVTQREWDQISVYDDARSFRGEHLPIENVPLETILAWIGLLGGGFRLPSEAEWEYACRAGTESLYFWGDEIDAKYVWYGDNSERRTHDVREHDEAANAFGLVDMAGNVHEWCADEHQVSYHQGPFDERPILSSNTSRNVARGGAWISRASEVRSASRPMVHRRRSHAYLGFRLARDFPLGVEER